jgi:predicted nucleic acid-binding protein
MRRRVVPVVVVDAKAAVAEIVETEEVADVGRTKVATRISKMTMIAKPVSWVPGKAKRTDKLVVVMDVVAAIVEIVEIGVATVSVVTVGAKSAVTAVTVVSRASVVTVRSVHRSLVSVSNVSLSLWTKRLASTLAPARLTESLVRL